MIFVEAVVLQHSVELLKILDVALERHLLLPATCSVHADICRGYREQHYEHSAETKQWQHETTEAPCLSSSNLQLLCPWSAELTLARQPAEAKLACRC